MRVCLYIYEYISFCVCVCKRGRKQPPFRWVFSRTVTGIILCTLFSLNIVLSAGHEIVIPFVVWATESVCFSLWFQSY